MQKGQFAGAKCYYRTALLNVLIKLKPKICLEIGTHTGLTAQVFTAYFEKYKADGKLITADIKKYVDIKSDFSKQVLVYPHTLNVAEYHDVSSQDMLAGWAAQSQDSVKANCRILKEELVNIGADHFDFCFIDGDHQEASLRKDLEIAKALSRYPHYALLDDTKEGFHECSAVYAKSIINEVSHYDFDDWPIFIGSSLIWSPDLS